MNKQHGIGLCDCCKGIDWLTPLPTDNIPSLVNLIYRIGTHSSFKESMITSLSRSSTLQNLTTRQDDDSSIALIDTWAVVLDILTFYQERIINEGYLGTAKERLSLFELAKHISYRVKPGVAANTWLAFTMDESVGSPVELSIDKGTKVQSIPEKNQNPQLFETLNEFEAKTKWNKIKPQLWTTQTLKKGDTELYLKGTNTQLQKGDAILIVENERTIDDTGSERWDIRIVDSIETDNENNVTLVKWLKSLGSDNPYKAPTSSKSQVFAFRQRAALFGYNAPDYRIMSEEIMAALTTNWNNLTVPNPKSKEIHLDAIYPKITKGSWLALVQPNYTELYNIVNIVASSRTDYALSTKTSLVKLNTDENLARFLLRKTVVLAQSELLEIAKKPITSSITGHQLSLNGRYPNLQIGQTIIINGELTSNEIDTERQTIIPTSLNQPKIESEAVIINDINNQGNHTVIAFQPSLKNTYIRKTVSINANTVYATHGETKIETLGSGDGSKKFQKFYLKQTPLTYISSTTPSGVASTLEVRVNDIKWKGAATLFNRKSEERIYITRQENDGTTYVQFGDGITGARLPSGIENIRATYRVGIGFEGLLKAKQLSLLMTPQIGLRSVLNPLATVGADNPESLKNIRRNAPLTNLTLDRVVSIQDFEDFANAFAGIGKARADLLWEGEDRIVHLTVASANGETVSIDLINNLISAINQVRHNNYKIVIQSFHQIQFSIKASIKVHADYMSEKVLEQIDTQLKNAFGFFDRKFGQSVAPSEIISIIQAVEGVIYVDLDKLANSSPFSRKHFQLFARPARWQKNSIKPAELLLIDTNKIDLSAI